MVVTDIRMPPSFQQEGIDAAKEVRKRLPGTGVVVLSQYDDPEYAITVPAPPPAPPSPPPGTMGRELSGQAPTPPGP